MERKPKIARPRLWRVVFYNDDYTPKWFVAMVFQQFFRMSETSATALMMAIHHKGKGVAGVYTRDIAETKAGDQCMARDVERGSAEETRARCAALLRISTWMSVP